MPLCGTDGKKGFFPTNFDNYFIYNPFGGTFKVVAFPLSKTVELSMVFQTLQASWVNCIQLCNIAKAAETKQRQRVTQSKVNCGYTEVAGRISRSLIQSVLIRIFSHSWNLKLKACYPSQHLPIFLLAAI
mmetsp:Transcript_13523/g.18306  ORF Transcript_13523/g.18306 Transcript_13523/m.18306 type:complete len:130 (+) Transcript_13523:347-736(+)